MERNNVSHSEEFQQLLKQPTEEIEGSSGATENFITGRFWNLFSWEWRWRPTSYQKLQEAEAKMLKHIGIDFEQIVVSIDDGHHISTIKVGSGPPLVLLHGFGAGVGFWNSNLKEFSEHFTVYAIDLPGFGRSSRMKLFFKNQEEAENFFLSSLEKWVDAIGLNQQPFYLLGHSFGGYLSAAYTLKNPHHVKHLILADPWGVPKRPENPMSRFPWRYRILIKIFSFLSPLSILRAAGPFGPGLIPKFRSDLGRKFLHLFDDPSIVFDYVYHLNAQEPTGERAFAALTIPVGWAKHPLEERMHRLSPEIKASFLFGSKTWMDKETGRRLAESLGLQAEYHVIPDAGHHIYVDNFAFFNQIVISCKNKWS